MGHDEPEDAAHDLRRHRRGARCGPGGLAAGTAAVLNAPASLDRLADTLAGLPSDLVAPPPGGRVAAALVVLRPLPDGDLDIVYTRRREDLRSHPGQISFPGGRVDPGETIDEAAVREAHEEVALDPGSVEIIGRLPSFYIPPSRTWLQSVVARWTRPHPLVAAEAEVAEIITVPLARLRDPDAWRTVRLTVSGWTWAWRLDGDHLLWGATAAVTTVLLGMLDPEWSGGASPGDFPEREVRPWEVAAPRAPRPPRLGDLPQIVFDDVRDRSRPDLDPDLDDDLIGAAGEAVALAVESFEPPRPGRVVVLAGSGRTGRVGRATADVLSRRGRDVTVVTTADFDGTLPDGAVVVDALVGGGLHGPLSGVPLAMLHALRTHVTPIVSVDLPSGVHPSDGLVGETVAAEVTVTIGAPPAGLFHGGLTPFVGDLYLATLDDPPLVRLVEPAGAWAE